MITMMDLDGMRQKVLESSNLLNDITPTLDAITLVTKMNEQRDALIDYIMKLEAFIKQHHNSDGSRRNL